MFRNILNLKNFSVSVCAALTWASYSSLSQSQSDKKSEISKFTKTYIWGNGRYQAKPDSYVQFKNFEPKLIESFLGENKINMKKIYFGEFHEAGIDINGNAYIWTKHIQHSSKEKNINDNEREGIILLDDSKSVKQIAFTKGFIWTLRNDGDVYQWPVNVKYDEDREEVKELIVGEKPRQVVSLKDIKQIATGVDHFVALTNKGEVLTMGDDTYGQCGLGADKRKSSPPFFEQRVKKPHQIENLPQIQKIVAGANHTLALSDSGSVYGWGNNSNLQLSHQKEFAAVENPLMALFSPVRLESNLSDSTVVDFSAGDEFSIFVTKNKSNNETEVFGCGHNLHGELGIGYLKHLSDISKIESLSNYKIKTDEGEKDINIKEISCGNNHCMVLLSIGVVMEWGANEYGQLGNKKRVFSENPLIINNFTKENVLNISCGHNNSAVITENVVKTSPEDKK